MNKIRLDVIGDPIDHSSSPLIHETVLKDLGIPYEYRKVNVKKGELLEYLKEVKINNIDGFNLTMPHKVDILPYLDYIDPMAELFNSVNTIKVQNGNLLGYNTDADGMFFALKEKGYCAKDKNIVILGAGGVVSTIALKMVIENAHSVTVLNRTLKKAESIKDLIFSKTGKNIFTNSLDLISSSEALKDCDILINGTPLGMHSFSEDFEDLTFLKDLKMGALVYDLIYNPPKTKLLKVAEEYGFSTLNGFGMLIYQGLLADKIFLGQELDFVRFKTIIEEKIKNLKKF